jgi:hypothetical protein
MGRRVPVYSVIGNGKERNGSIMCMARIREAMRLKFYHFLFLKRCVEMEKSRMIEKKDNLGEGDVQEVWNRWTVVNEDAGNGPGKEQGLPEKARCMLRRVKGMVLRR